MIVSCALEHIKPGGKNRAYFATTDTGERIRLRRVSNIVDVISKPGLPYYSAKMTTAYLEEALRPGRAYSAGQLSYHLSVAKEFHQEWKATTAEMGTEAHEWIHRFFTHGEWPGPEAQLRTEVVNSLELFAQLWQDSNCDLIESEFCVWSETYQYAGTVDAIVYNYDTASFELWDWKTGDGIWSSHIYQVRAYMHALHEMGAAGYPVSGAVIGRIGRTDAQYDCHRPTDEELDLAWSVFRSACEIHPSAVKLDGKLSRRNKQYRERMDFAS